MKGKKGKSYYLIALYIDIYYEIRHGHMDIWEETARNCKYKHIYLCTPMHPYQKWTGLLSNCGSILAKVHDRFE